MSYTSVQMVVSTAEWIDVSGTNSRCYACKPIDKCAAGEVAGEVSADDSGETQDQSQSQADADDNSLECTQLSFHSRPITVYPSLFSTRFKLTNCAPLNLPNVKNYNFLM